ncbi:AAA family ATPase [Mesorhizobium zhangyense]|uniref:AAA family ATPase n=1 Tax=Mesorhizobium zhangyense TaxID=1776730 RepID=UPI001FE5FFF5|nr:AAA family ATPase [Mesorhizobium zhangyense]
MAPLPKTQPEEESAYVPGDRVVHDKWGSGTVSLSEGVSVSVSFDAGGNRTILAGYLRSGSPKADNDNENPTNFLPYLCPAEWQDVPVPAREWWSEGLVPMRQVTILNGDGGVGKSLAALQLAAAGALQCDTLGLRPMAGRVLYVGAEDEAEEFHRRLADIVNMHHRQMSDLTDFRLLPLADRDALLAVPEKDGTMRPTPLWLTVAVDARAFLPKLIVLDTSADLFGGDEIKRNQVRQFISMLRKLAIEIDCAIILLSHPSVSGMQTGTGSSGSTAWNNSARSRLYLTRPEGKDEDPDARILRTMKANYGKVGAELRLRWQDGAFVLDDGRPSAIAGLLHKHAEKTYIAVLSKLNRQGQRLSPNPSATYAPKVIATHPDAKGVSKKDLAAAQQRLLDAGTIRIVSEGPPSRQYNRLLVASETYGGVPSN